MSFLRNIVTGLRSLFQKEQVDLDLDEELRGYQELAAEEKMKSGMSRKEALRAVRFDHAHHYNFFINHHEFMRDLRQQQSETSVVQC